MGSLGGNMMDDDGIGEVVEETHPEHPHDEFEEVVVVFLPNAVVKVPTVVVESIAASIALPTMLRPYQHMSLAYLTVELIDIGIEVSSLIFIGSLQSNGRITWITHRRHPCVVKSAGS
jgi:hypothetical protein